MRREGKAKTRSLRRRARARARRAGVRLEELRKRRVKLARRLRLLAVGREPGGARDACFVRVCFFPHSVCLLLFMSSDANQKGRRVFIFLGRTIPPPLHPIPSHPAPPPMSESSASSPSPSSHVNDPITGANMSAPQGPQAAAPKPAEWYPLLHLRHSDMPLSAYVLPCLCVCLCWGVFMVWSERVFLAVSWLVRCGARRTARSVSFLGYSSSCFQSHPPGAPEFLLTRGGTGCTGRPAAWRPSPLGRGSSRWPPRARRPCPRRPPRAPRTAPPAAP